MDICMYIITVPAHISIAGAGLIALAGRDTPLATSVVSLGSCVTAVPSATAALAA